MVKINTRGSQRSRNFVGGFYVEHKAQQLEEPTTTENEGARDDLSIVCMMIRHDSRSFMCTT